MQNRIKFIIAVAAVAVCGLFAHAATIDSTVGGTGIGYAARDSGNTYVIDRTLDVTNWATVGTNVVQALKVTSGTVVHAVGYQVITATTNGATFTLDVGDGSDEDGYIAAGATTSGAWGASSPATVTATPTFTTATVTNGASSWVVVTNGTVAVTIAPAYGIGKFYASDDTIDAVWNSLTADTTTGRVRVWAVVSDGRAK